jgi:hypothetical protein
LALWLIRDGHGCTMKHRLNHTGLPETERIAQELDRAWGITQDDRAMAGEKPKRNVSTDSEGPTEINQRH